MIQTPGDSQDSQEIDVSLELPCACEYMCNALKQKAPTHTCTFARIHTNTQKTTMYTNVQNRQKI